MLIPMNVDSTGWDDKFINSTKLIILVVLMFVDVGTVAYLIDSFMPTSMKVIIVIGLIIMTQLVFRYFIFEEKYYYRMYKKMQQYKISNPSVFWNIAMMKDTDEGCIMVYADGKAGIMIRLERDTITGKPTSFKETHFDAVSDFYKELNLKGLHYIQMNIMEVAGKDPRLAVLDRLVLNPDNKNISKLVEAEVGYLKKVTRSTLYESDYVLVYTNDIDKRDTLISDSIDCVYKLLEGGFIGYSILTSREILDRVKDEYGVKYFDYTEATVNMYRNIGLSIPEAVAITSVEYTSGEVEEVDSMGRKRLNALTSYIERGVLKKGEWTVSRALQGEIRKDKNKKDLVGFEDITGIREEARDYVIDLDKEVFDLYEDDEQSSEYDEGKPSFIDELLYPEQDNNENILDYTEPLIDGNQNIKGKKKKSGRGLLKKHDKQTEGLSDTTQQSSILDKPQPSSKPIPSKLDKQSNQMQQAQQKQQNQKAKQVQQPKQPKSERPAQSEKPAPTPKPKAQPVKAEQPKTTPQSTSTSLNMADKSSNASMNILPKFEKLDLTLKPDDSASQPLTWAQKMQGNTQVVAEAVKKEEGIKTTKPLEGIEEMDSSLVGNSEKTGVENEGSKNDIHSTDASRKNSDNIKVQNQQNLQFSSIFKELEDDDDEIIDL